MADGTQMIGVAVLHRLPICILTQKQTLCKGEYLRLTQQIKETYLS